MTQLLEYTEEVLAKYPQLKPDVDALIQLCIDEIDEGGSESHEQSLCWSDVSELVKSHEASLLSRNI
jgi:hypothetical protein